MRIDSFWFIFAVPRVGNLVRFFKEWDSYNDFIPAIYANFSNTDKLAMFCHAYNPFPNDQEAVNEFCEMYNETALTNVANDSMGHCKWNDIGVVYIGICFLEIYRSCTYMLENPC